VVSETTAPRDLRGRVTLYLRSHHTMTVATVGPVPGETGAGRSLPHAATVFYAVDDDLRLIFLSKPTSTHGLHIGVEAPVAVTVAAHYDDWQLIQGVQLWGVARLLRGKEKAIALAVYLRRFPFVRELMKQPQLVGLFREIGVYRMDPQRVAFTDNSTGVFGRQVLELVIQ